MDTFWGLLIFFGVAVLAAGAALVLYKKLHPRTEDSERRKVSRALRSFAAPRGYKVIDSPVLVSNGLSGWADHILVGYFGVLLVYDLCYAGEYFGGPDEEQWVIADEGKRYSVPNPSRAAAQCSGRVLTLCRDAGHRVPVEQVAVITFNGKKTISYIKSPEVIKMGKLRGYLNRARFDEDRGVNVEAVTAVLEAARKN